MAVLGHRSPNLALYYCRLAQQKDLNDQRPARSGGHDSAKTRLVDLNQHRSSCLRIAAIELALIRTEENERNPPRKVIAHYNIL
jgi:hypothetical protein